MRRKAERDAALLSASLYIFLPLSPTPPSTLSSSSASGSLWMLLNHIYWAKAMCECFLIVAANISSGASLSLALSLSLTHALCQLMWFGKPACLHSHLIVINNKMTPWLDNFSPHMTSPWLQSQTHSKTGKRTHTWFCLGSTAAVWILGLIYKCRRPTRWRSVWARFTSLLMSF